MPRFLILALGLTLSAARADSPALPPTRIVSLSLCSDELLLALVDPSRIASLTWLSAEPAFSPVADRAANMPLNHGLAEEVIAAQPDLVLGMAFSATTALRLLQGAGHPVEVLPMPSSLEDSYALIERTGGLTGDTARAARLVAAMQHDVAASLDILSALPARRALFLSPNGLSYGSGTLRDDFLAQAGWTNVAAELGLNGPGHLPLESLLTADIDTVILTRPGRFDTWLSYPLQQHPAMQARLDKTPTMIIPDAWFQCAGPSLVQAWQALANFTVGEEGRL